MAGDELGGRLIALEAVVVAFASKITSSLLPDERQKVFDDVKKISHAIIKDMVPALMPAPPIVKKIADHADSYVDAWVEVIQKSADNKGA